MKRIGTWAKQGGFTALEMLVVLIVTVAALGLGGQYLMSYADGQVNQAAADHNKTIADAATKYIKDNYAAILATATASTPATITVPMLKSTGYLTSSVTDQNPYGQTYLILALEPVANKLETLIVTSGGETIPEMGLRRIAQASGARGGFISSTNTAVATGSYGGWQMPLASYGTSPGAGHLATALFFDDGALVSDYLYRSAVAGHPEFNRMNTAIDMAGNNINNAGTVNATTVNTSGETYTGGWFRTQGDSGWYSQKWNGGWYMSDPNWVRSYADKNVYTGGQMQASTMRSNGRLSTGEFLQLDAVAGEGGGCSPWGLAGRDANGLPLSCQYGVWRYPTQAMPSGQRVCQGAACLYGDGWNAALRQPGDLYIQSQDGSALRNIYGNDYYIGAIGKWASQISGGIKSYAEFDWFPGYGTYGTGLPYWNWYCAVTRVGGKYAGGGEDIQVYRDGGSGTWIVSGSSLSDNGGAHAHITCLQLS